MSGNIEENATLWSLSIPAEGDLPQPGANSGQTAAALLTKGQLKANQTTARLTRYLLLLLQLLTWGN